MKGNLSSSNASNESKRGFFSVLRGKTSIADIAKVVSYQDINGNKKEENPKLNGDISHIYMGKMNEEEFGIYSDDFLRGILQYYFLCTPKGQNVSLELANCVSEVLGENMQGFMNFATQKAYIQEFVEKYFGKKEVKRLNIIDLEARHPKLFQRLRVYENTIKQEAATHGLGLGELEKTPSFDNLDHVLGAGQEKPILPDTKSDFTSLDIAKHLYRVAKNNPSFLQRIQNIKPEKAKSVWYPVIEIALRLTDILKGVHIQGGAIKQKEYDAIIRDILNPYKNIADYPELADLRTFCTSILGKATFETIYMDGNSKKYRAFTEKITEEKQETTAKRRIVGFTAGMLLTALSLYGGVKIYQQRELKNQLQKTINEIFENKRLTYSGEYGRGEYVGKEKIERVNSYIDDIYKRFETRYGKIAKEKEIWFRSKIADCINNQKLLDMLGGYKRLGPTSEDIVIDEYLIPQNFSEFQTLDIPTKPYEKYAKYRDAFINTILLDQDFSARRDTAIMGVGYRGGNTSTRLIDDIGIYAPKYQRGEPSIFSAFQIATMKHGGKDVILALHDRSGSSIEKKDGDVLSTGLAKDLAIDFLKETSPVINILLDQYLLRYYSYYGNGMSMLEDGTFVSTKQELSIRTEGMILKEFLRKGLIDSVGKDDKNRINKFLDELVIEQGQNIKASGGEYRSGEIVQNLMPNGHFQEYEEAMKNTLTDTTGFIGARKTSFITPRYGDESLALDKALGKYMDNDGKIYLLGLTSYKGKKYLCAREEVPSDYYMGRYFTLECGKKVANDYFAVKAAFLQKKLLREKKQKSAQQSHRALSRDQLNNFPGGQNKLPPR